MKYIRTWDMFIKQVPDNYELHSVRVRSKLTGNVYILRETTLNGDPKTHIQQVSP